MKLYETYCCALMCFHTCRRHTSKIILALYKFANQSNFLRDANFIKSILCVEQVVKATSVARFKYKQEHCSEEGAYNWVYVGIVLILFSKLFVQVYKYKNKKFTKGRH